MLWSIARSYDKDAQKSYFAILLLFFVRQKLRLLVDLQTSYARL